MQYRYAANLFIFPAVIAAVSCESPAEDADETSQSQEAQCAAKGFGAALSDTETAALAKTAADDPRWTALQAAALPADCHNITTTSIRGYRAACRLDDKDTSSASVLVVEGICLNATKAPTAAVQLAYFANNLPSSPDPIAAVVPVDPATRRVLTPQLKHFASATPPGAAQLGQPRLTHEVGNAASAQTRDPGDMVESPRCLDGKYTTALLIGVLTALTVDITIWRIPIAHGRPSPSMQVPAERETNVQFAERPLVNVTRRLIGPALLGAANAGIILGAGALGRWYAHISRACYQHVLVSPAAQPATTASP